MFFTLALLLASSGQQEPVKYSHLRMPLHSILYEGKLYGFFEMKQPTHFIPHSIELKKSGKEAHNRYGLVLQSSGTYFRLRIAFNRIWFSDGTPGIKSLSFDDLNFFEERAGRDGRGAFYKKYDVPGAKEEFGVIYLAGLKNHVRIEQFFVFPSEEVAGFGTVPISETACRTFVLFKDGKKFEAWDTEVKFDADTKRFKVFADNLRPESFESLFLEDFYVFIRKDTYYFVTESGKLYSAPPPKAGAKWREMEGLWTNPKRPIVAVIEDANNDRVWLFAKDKSPGAKLDFRFEMKEALLARTFDPTKLEPSKVEGRAKTLLEYLPLIPADAKEKAKKAS